MSPELPFPYSYWAVPGKILAGCCPGSIDADNDLEQLTGLVDAGVTLVINLMEKWESELYQNMFADYESTLAELARARGRKLRMLRFPIRDRSLPTPEQMTSILQTIRDEVQAGGIVYVHCLGGIGRTGTVIGCHLVEQGQPKPLDQLKKLTAAEWNYFWPTPQTDEQRKFVLDWKNRGTTGKPG